MKKYNFNFHFQDGELTFAISGQIDSGNAPDLYEDFAVIRKQYGDVSVIFDCENLSHVTSSGLHFFARVFIKENKKIKLINVSHDVYEHLESAGFINFFDVAKALRDISDENFQKIGNGGGVEIYSASDELLLKVYPECTEISTIELERELSHSALLHGIPMLIAFDIVKYQGKIGLLYEHLNAKTVAAIVKENPEKEKFYASAMGRLWKKIHSFTPTELKIPAVSELNKNLVQGMSKWLNPEEINALTELINAIPEAETMLYYHFNPENIFVQNEELILINMTNIRTGNPLFDFARAYRPYQRIKDFWKTMLHAYFKTGNIKKKEKTIEAASLLGQAFSPASHKFFSGKEMAQERINNAIEKARCDLFPNVKQIISLFAQYH